MQPVLIGSDPEYFVKHGETIHHAIGTLGGSKKNPRPVFSDDFEDVVGYVQEDNVLVEFNTTPTANADEFASNMADMLKRSADLLKPVGLLPVAISHHEYGSELASFPNEAHVFGCDPDINTYTGKKNEMPQGGSSSFRSAGGHVHIGFDELCENGLETETCLQVGQMCDILLGLWGTVHGDSTERKKLYGRAGSIRIKPYGIEYRTLDNFWIWSEEKVKEVHRRAQLCFIDRDRIAQIHEMFPPALIQSTINSGDVAMAKIILEALGYE